MNCHFGYPVLSSASHHQVDYYCPILELITKYLQTYILISLSTDMHSTPFVVSGTSVDS